MSQSIGVNGAKMVLEKIADAKVPDRSGQLL